MNVHFERIQSTAHRYFESVLNLYLNSFPKEERREPDSLAEVIHEPGMNFCAVEINGQMSGMVVFWKFDSFLYIEHLAVLPELHRGGIGSLVLKRLQELGSPILLEVEIPFDTVGRNRVGFYLKAGFSQLPVEYFQPPYRDGEQLLPMMLFSDTSGWTRRTLDQCIEEFRFQVYFKWHTPNS